MSNQVNLSVGFDVDKGSLSEIYSSLKSLQKLTAGDILKISPNLGEHAVASELREIKNAAEDAYAALKLAFNTDLNTLNISRFNDELKKVSRNGETIYGIIDEKGNAIERSIEYVIFDGENEITGIYGTYTKEINKVSGTDVDLSQFENLGKVTYYDVTNQDQVRERIRDANIVITNKNISLENGKLGDIAPTILELMNLEIR